MFVGLCKELYRARFYLMFEMNCSGRAGNVKSVIKHLRPDASLSNFTGVVAVKAAMVNLSVHRARLAAQPSFNNKPFLDNRPPPGPVGGRVTWADDDGLVWPAGRMFPGHAPPAESNNVSPG
jgi:hypothetical protein